MLKSIFNKLTLEFALGGILLHLWGSEQ